MTGGLIGVIVASLLYGLTWRSLWFPPPPTC